MIQLSREQCVSSCLYKMMPTGDGDSWSRSVMMTHHSPPPIIWLSSELITEGINITYIIIVRLQLQQSWVQSWVQSTRHSFGGLLCPISSTNYSPGYRRVSCSVLSAENNYCFVVAAAGNMFEGKSSVFRVVKILMLRLYMFGKYNNNLRLLISPDK